MGILLGGPKSYKKYRAKGGISVFLEWFDPERDEVGMGEPALIISRANKFALSGNRGCATIMLEQAYLYADSKRGEPTPRLMLFSKSACEAMGMEPSRMNIFAIASAIVDALPDLVAMPPAPNPDKFASRKAKPIGEVSLTVDGKCVSEGEIH